MSKLTDHSVFTKQFREELIKDLDLSPSILCPKCNLNYVDNWNEDMCRYECEESDSSEEDRRQSRLSTSELCSREEESKVPKKYEVRPSTTWAYCDNSAAEVRQQSWLTEPGHCPGEVVCVFDFYDTPLTEVIDEWLRKLLRMCGDDEELKNKWKQKINEAINKKIDLRF